MSETFQSVILATAVYELETHIIIDRAVWGSVYYRTAEFWSAFPSCPMKHAHEARLTYNVDRHVKKQSVPRYHVESTAKSPSPFPEPDTLGFAFEED